MNSTILPQKLQKGDTIMIIAPANSMSTVPAGHNFQAQTILEEELDLDVVYAVNSHEITANGSASVQDRVEDIHNAFLDYTVKAILCFNGGAQTADLLENINWEIIRANPKLIIGSPDTTVLLNEITARTGLKTYIGPSFHQIGMDDDKETIIQNLEKCLFEPVFAY